MFGHDDQTQTMPSDGAMMPQQDVPADGTLGAPMNDNSSMPMQAPDGAVGMPAPATSDTTPAYEPANNTDMTSASARDMHAQTPEELISIKQEALQSLKPLVGHLEQTAEEHFRTTMMMIQASDDQSLIPEAYEAAKSIEDDKVRAQALLDVVNEINYFTAQHAQQ
jgi:hypothetical protein